MMPKFFLYSLDNKKVINSGLVGDPKTDEACILNLLTVKKDLSVLTLIGK